MYNAHTIFLQIKKNCQVYKKKKSVYTDITEYKYIYICTYDNNLIYILLCCPINMKNKITPLHNNRIIRICL